MSREHVSIGKIIVGEAHRDAIHVAIAPLVASGCFMPGAHVGLDESGNAAEATMSNDVDAIGVADPFLLDPIRPGQRFYVFLYPGSATGLRHVYAHPALDRAGATNASAKQTSEEWMRNWAREHMSTDYYGDTDAPLSDEQSYANAINAGHNMHVGPYEDARNHIDNEWWAHWEAITGQRGQRGEYFSCGC
jgi:hypothetical protein